MKRMIAMTMALAALLGLCSCSAERQREPSLYEEISIMDANERNEPDETDHDYGSTDEGTYPVEKDPDEREPEEKEERSYASETLSIRGITDQYKNEFVALLNRTGDDILLEGNKVKDCSKWALEQNKAATRCVEFHSPPRGLCN